MNTYNENLRSSIVASLQSQELDQKAVSAELNASMFTLYYAEGATITANEKLNQATKEREEKTLVKHQAVTAGNISNNQLASATQGSQNVKQATTNAAVCAANVQVAANAIFRLASDLGSIYSIINAADSDSDIYRQAQEARDLINTTAYEAEVASQMAMEASMLVSQVSASTVMDKSTATNSAMTAMLTIANSDYNTLSQTVSDANANVAAASAKEKVAEGNFEDLTTANASTDSAYALTNQELNLNLLVTPKLNAESSEMLVGFNLIKYPFKMQEIDLPGKIDISPVKQYYLIFCKDRKKTTFSYFNAESLISTGAEKQYVAVNMPAVTTPNPKGHGNPAVTLTGKSAVNVDIKYMNFQDTEGSFYTLQDADGDEIVPGTNYVVFLLATYADDYKKKLNNFDDFLSAPSPVFCLTHTLNPVNDPIYVFPVSTDIKKEKGLALPKDFDQKAAIKLDNDTWCVAFNIAETTDFKVDYRCIFLPAGNDLTKDLLNSNGIKDLESEVEILQKISDKFNPLISEMQANILQTSSQIEAVQALITDFRAQSKNQAAGSPQKKETDAALAEAKKDLDKLNAEYKKYHAAFNQLSKEKQQAVSSLNAETKDKLGFVFNLTLAEQVLPGNFTSAALYPVKVLPSTATTADDIAPGIDPNSKTQYLGFATIGPETTDNFGNSLISGNSYYPVVLSYSIADEDNLAMFTNALTDIKSADLFTYELNSK